MKRLQQNIASNQGVAIILLIIILVVATAIGIWGLTSSRSSIMKAGSRKFATELTYKAEQGLQKSVRRIQSIAAGTGDQVANINNKDTSSGKTGGNYSSKTLNFLLDNICADTTCGGTPNPACGNFDPLKNFDSVTQNVICNFLGVVDDSTQVSLVRKDDLIANGETFGIFLVNSIAMDSSGRRQAIQGVVVVPYSGGAGAHVSTAPAYLASSKTVTD